mgnify:CR=1 FL=1
MLVLSCKLLLHEGPALLHKVLVEGGHVEAGRDVRDDPEQAHALAPVADHIRSALKVMIAHLLGEPTEHSGRGAAEDMAHVVV